MIRSCLPVVYTWTTPPPAFPSRWGVTDAMVRYARELGASAGRGAYAEAIETGALIGECRRRLNKLLHGENPDHFVFTLNCSDALNLALKGLIQPGEKSHRHLHAHRPQFHSAAAECPVDAGLTDQTRVPVDSRTGLVDPNEIRKAMRPDTKLIAITHAAM